MMSDHKQPAPAVGMDDPAEKMAELEHEIELQDARKKKDDEKAVRLEEEKKAPVDKKNGEPVRESEKDRDGDEREEPVEESEAGNGEDPSASPDQAVDGTRSADSLWWNAAIVLCLALVVGMGYLYYTQSENMPMTPLEKAALHNAKLRELQDRTLLDFKDAQMKELLNQKMEADQQELYATKLRLAEKERKISDLQNEILGLRGQMKHYFAAYKNYARNNARKLQFDSITTVKTRKTYMKVEIRRVTDSMVSIVHAGGATNLDPSDLSEALRNRLAFGDPLGLETMDEEQSREEEQKNEIGKYLPLSSPASSTPAPKPRVNADALLEKNFDPPSKLPDVSTPSPSTINDGWVPPRAPAPFAE